MLDVILRIMEKIDSVQNEIRKETGIHGILVEKMVRCGKQNCRCKNGRKHGPYLYRQFYNEKKRLCVRYVKKKDAETFRRKWVNDSEFRRKVNYLQRLQALLQAYKKRLMKNT